MPPPPRISKLGKKKGEKEEEMEEKGRTDLSISVIWGGGSKILARFAHRVDIIYVLRAKNISPPPALICPPPLYPCFSPHSLISEFAPDNLPHPKKHEQVCGPNSIPYKRRYTWYPSIYRYTQGSSDTGFETIGKPKVSSQLYQEGKTQVTPKFVYPR